MGNLNKKTRKRKYYEMILIHFLIYLFILFLFNLNIVECVNNNNNKRKYLIFFLF